MEQIKPIVIPAKHEHCEAMADHLRSIDKREMWMSSTLLPRDGLIFSFEHSQESYSVMAQDSDIPMMMFGIGPEQSLLNKKRQIWMLATDRINEVSFKFLRECGDYMNLISAGSTVYNYVIEGNNKTLKWLHWLGFTILKPKPFGILNQNFHYVEKKIPCALIRQPQQS